MPSSVVTMAVATRTLVTERRNAKIRPDSIFVDNVNGAADAVLVFNDVFTPSVSNGVAVPVLQTVPRLQLNIGMGTAPSTMDWMKNISFVGLVQVVRGGGIDANCVVSFIYHFEDDPPDMG